MKAFVIIMIFTFIIATGISMFLTGTFEQLSAQTTEEQEETEKAKGEDADSSDDNTSEQEKSSHQDQEIEESEAKIKAIVEDYKAQIAAVKAELDEAKSLKARSQQLAKIYSGMKPDDAASILCHLDEDLSARILNEMNTRTAGKVMGAIASQNPDYGSKLSKLIASRDL